MCHTHLELDPETDARVAAALDAAVAAMRAGRQDDDVSFEHLHVDALVELITGARSTGHQVPELSVLIDLDTLRHGLHDHTVAETSDGHPLPVGHDPPARLPRRRHPDRPRRRPRPPRPRPRPPLATRDQRRALRAMYQTCGHPDCTVRFDACRIHHVHWWDQLGPTNLDNMIPLCEQHHHLVHDGQWTLSIKPDRTITLRRPDGTLHFEGPTTNRNHRPDRTTQRAVALSSADEVGSEVQRGSTGARRDDGVEGGRSLADRDPPGPRRRDREDGAPATVARPGYGRGDAHGGRRSPTTS